MDKKNKLFQTFNDFFDQIYLITLKRSTERHELIKKVLEGLDYSIFWAFDGRDLNVEELVEKGLYHPYHTKLLRKRLGKTPSDITRSQLGCALSHLHVYKDIVNKNYSKALVFEDDLVLSDEAIDSTIKALSELPEDWELLRLGHFGANSDPSLLLKIQKWGLQSVTPFFQKFERLRVLDPNVIRCWFSRPYSENLNRSGYHFGNHAYAVTLKGAQKILNHQTPIVQRSDNAISELCSYEWLNGFNLKKRLFYQNNTLTSTIDGQP
jgi:glycosyl transferase family 25